MATQTLNQITGMPNLPLSSGLLETKQKTPKGYVGAAEIGPAYEELRGAEAQAEQKVGEADINIEKAKREEKATEAEKRLALIEQQGKELRELPERKTVQELRGQMEESAFVPTKETFQDLTAMFTLMGVIGMVMGKGNAQLGMSAMNGMLEGHQKGRADLYKKEKDIFDKNFKVLQQKITTAEKALEEAIKLKSVDKEAGEQRILMEIYKSESPLLKAIYEKQGPVAALNAVKGARKDVDSVVQLQNNMQKAADDRQARKDAIAAANERARLARIAADERARLAREQALKLAEIKASSPKALKKGEFQANYIGDIIGRPVDPDAAAKAAAGTMYKMSLKELQDLNMKLGGAPGLKVTFVDYMNKYLATKAGVDGKFDLTDLQAAYDNLEKNDKSFRAMSDNSKLLAKKELDSVMSYLQVKYGNRAPVAEFRAAQTVLNRGNMTPTAYNNVVEAQIKDTDNRLGAAGFKPKDILALNKHFAQNRSDLDLLSGVEDDVEDADLYTSPYEFSSVVEAEAFLESVGLPKMKAKVGGQEGIVTPRGQ